MLTAPFLLTKYFWPAMKRERLGAHHQYQFGTWPARLGIQVGLYQRQTWRAGPDQDRGSRRRAPYGITVNSICPAYVRTPLVDNQIDSQAKTHGIPREEVISSIMLKKAAVKRMIEPNEVGDLVVYLCSDSAGLHHRFNDFTIDCGWTAA